MNKLKLFTAFISLLVLTNNAVSAAVETKTLNIGERAYGLAEVPIEMTIPDGVGPFPVIISQHGSERDGREFKGSDAATDEYSKRLVDKATQEGFAVIALDAFYKKNLSAGDKTKFPSAEIYASAIRDGLTSDSRLDSKNIFYTGFSYGGKSVLSTLYSSDIIRWRALVAAEPDCNSFPAPPSFSVPPILIMKGGESHYGAEACEHMKKFYANANLQIDWKFFPKSNHYFSHNGKIVNGLAFNGCSDNPVVIYGRNKFTRVDGTPITREEIGKCFTKKAGSGKSREDLDAAVEATIGFFKQHLVK
jgi:dienelactone hydrolase